MEITDSKIVQVIGSKNFKKFVIWSKGWPQALIHFAGLLEEVNFSGRQVNEPNISKKLIELKIPSALKKEAVTMEEVEQFFRNYKIWAYEHGLSEPRHLTPSRVIKIKSILRNYSPNEITLMFKNASASNFIMENSFFSIDWITKLGNFIKVLEGNYSNKTQGLMGDF